MKKLLSILLTLLFCSFTSWGQSKKVVVYGAAFYNLENLYDTINNNGKYDLEFTPKGARQWNTQKYYSKLDNMAYAISQMANKYIKNGPALIGVAELENRAVLEDLVSRKTLKKWNLQVVHYDSPDRRGVDVGLLYNPKLFKVLNTNSHALILSHMPDFKTRDQLVVTGLLGGDKVSVIVNHWPSRLGGEDRSSPMREFAAQLVMEIVDSLYQEDLHANIIIMGDLNDDPYNKSVSQVINARKTAEEVEPNGFFNATWGLYDKGIGTLAYKGQWNLFDQIIISSNLLGEDRTTLKYWKAEVLNKPFLINEEGQYKGYPKRTFAGGVFLNGYSDHFPAMIYLVKYTK